MASSRFRRPRSRRRSFSRPRTASSVRSDDAGQPRPGSSETTTRPTGFPLIEADERGTRLGKVFAAGRAVASARAAEVEGVNTAFAVVGVDLLDEFQGGFLLPETSIAAGLRGSPGERFR